MKKFLPQITPQNKFYYVSENKFLVLGALQKGWLQGCCEFVV